MDENQEPCTHDEHDHGICLDCGEDITQELVSKAEAAADAAQDR
jgi:Fe2+ or Zn2+ uptake regulation protein